MTTLAGALWDKAKVFKSELGTSGADTLLQSVLCLCPYPPDVSVLSPVVRIKTVCRQGQLSPGRQNVLLLRILLLAL